MSNDNFSWVSFHNKVKDRYLNISQKLWWGDDLDVRFYLLKNLMQLKNKSILDVGCNIGITLSFLDESNELHGIEIDEYCVQEAQKLNEKANIVQGSMDSLPFSDNSFDVVYVSHTVPGNDFPVENKESFRKKTFDEIYRVLKPNGKLYLTTPNRNSIYYRGKKNIDSKDLKEVVSQFKINIFSGWHYIKPVFPKFLKDRYRFIPPKVLCNFESIWLKNINDLGSKKNIADAKSFYIEAIK